MLHWVRLSIFAVLPFLAASCTHYYYITPTQNVPLLQEKDDFRASASVGGGQEISTVNIQAAWAWRENYALMANYMWADGGEKSNNSGNGNYLDAGVGYFTLLGENFVFETFAGLGYGEQNHRYPTALGNNISYGPSSAYLNFSRLFLQPSIGFSHSAFDIALTPAISNIHFFRVNNARNDPDVAEIDGNKNSFLFEPGITARFGWKYAKLQVQYVHMFNISNPNLKFEADKISLGISIAFSSSY